MSKFTIKIKAAATLVISALPYLSSSSALAMSDETARLEHIEFTLKRGREIGGRDQKLENELLRDIANFDGKHNEILAVVRWQGSSGPGTVLAVREGDGRVSGCSIFEKMGNGSFDSVTGGAFCRFLISTGEFNEKSNSIIFKGKIRQGYDSCETKISFELFYDEKSGIFCDPLSQSDRFKCRVGVGH
jgi:hypothetical protein